VPAAADQERIARIIIEEPERIRLSPAVEQERRVALYDLIEESCFALCDGRPGPYVLHLAIEAPGRLRFLVHDATDQPLTSFLLPLGALEKVIKDYFLICESYFGAIRNLPPSRIEAIDMGRRGLHDEGAELLRERLADKVRMDKTTARRLFTLICVMHIRG
jgi:uncharacterized protein (UPF0262 family)